VVAGFVVGGVLLMNWFDDRAERATVRRHSGAES
jgi:hypothetical protein